mmetsp:Transcript_16112/g.43811  ORF Transcript_16112/g.43811 Transcript_16112/m.43811 type:complete len:235 (+) Transcript_16112:324-1028(+)
MPWCRPRRPWKALWNISYLVICPRFPLVWHSSFRISSDFDSGLSHGRRLRHRFRQCTGASRHPQPSSPHPCGSQDQSENQTARWRQLEAVVNSTRPPWHSTLPQRRVVPQDQQQEEGQWSAALLVRRVRQHLWKRCRQPGDFDDGTNSGPLATVSKHAERSHCVVEGDQLHPDLRDRTVAWKQIRPVFDAHCCGFGTLLRHGLGSSCDGSAPSPFHGPCFDFHSSPTPYVSGTK